MSRTKGRGMDDMWSSSHGKSQNSIEAGMTPEEARAIVLMRCKMYLEPEQIAQSVSIIWSRTRVVELVGALNEEETGEALMRASEEALELQDGELERLVIEECTCTMCGHRSVYLTSSWDAPKSCVKCGCPDSVFLPTVDTDLID